MICLLPKSLPNSQLPIHGFPDRQVRKIELPTICSGFSTPKNSRIDTGRSRMLVLDFATLCDDIRVPGTRSRAMEWSPDHAHGLRLIVGLPVEPSTEVEALR